MSSTVAATIVSIKRLTSSQNGNPRWLLVLDEDPADPQVALFTVRTKVDASLGYAVGNPGFQVGCPGTATLELRGDLVYLADWTPA
jgi:hypothetical protein